MSLDAVFNKGRITQQMFESVDAKKPEVKKPEEDKETPKPMVEALDDLGDQLERGEAIATVLEWVESGDPTAENFDAMAQALADVDEDEDEVSDDEEAEYAYAVDGMADALSYLGVDDESINGLINGDDKAASKVFVQVSESVEGKEDMFESVAEFSVEPMLEAKKKVVRNGKTKWVKKPLRKKRLSAAQRAGLKKARRKSNSSAAKAKRKRSMKKRKSSGM